MKDEKQAHPRTRGRIRVRYGVEKLDRSGFTMNVSLTGAFIRTNNVYAPGSTIKTEFNFEDGPVTVHARVVWAKKVPLQMAHLLNCGMGVRFVNPGPEWTELFSGWETKKAGG